MWSPPSLAPIKMAEMLVALWLSCCKPQSPGRVKPTFKPKPRYRQRGQQQWHISSYPETKRPSFVCNPHSVDLAFWHVEWSQGGWRGVRLALCSHLTCLHCLWELRWNLLPSESLAWLTLVCSLRTLDRFHVFCVCPFLVCFSMLPFKFGSPAGWTSKRATTAYQERHYLPSPCESLWDQWDLHEGENNPSVGQMIPYGQKELAAFLWKWKQVL